MIRAVWRFMLWLITEGGLVEAGEGEGLVLLGVRVLVFLYRDGSLRVTVLVTDPTVDDVKVSASDMTIGVIVVTLTTGTGVESFVIVNTVVSSTRS